MPIVEMRTEKTENISKNFMKFRTEIFYAAEKIIKDYYADVFKMSPGDIMVTNLSPYDIDIDVKFLNTDIPKKRLKDHLRRVTKNIAQGLPTLYNKCINNIKMTAAIK